MVYSMYEPLARNNTKRVNSLLGYYNYVYIRISYLVVFFGILILFLLPFLVAYEDIGVNIYIAFSLHLFGSFIALRLFPYKFALLNAIQRRNLITTTYAYVNIISGAVQIFVLIFFKNYIYFVIVVIISIGAKALIVSYLYDKKFSHYKPQKRESNRYLKFILLKVKMMFGHKLGDVVIYSSDTLIISSFLGLAVAGIYSSYNYVILALFTIVDSILLSVLASIGVSLASAGENKRKYALFKNIHQLYVIFMGFFAIILLNTYQVFIHLWVGGNYIIDNNITILLFVLYFLTIKFRGVMLVYRDAAGIWELGYAKPYVGVVVNILLSIVLVRYFGVNGVLLSTILVMLLIYFPWEVRIAHKFFGVNATQRFLIDTVLLLLWICLIGALTWYVVTLFNFDLTFSGLIYRFVLSFGVSGVLLALLAYRFSAHRLAMKILDKCF